VNPDVNDHWLCDYGRFSYETYETDRVVVPKVRNEDEYLGISTWGEAMDAIAAATAGAKDIRVVASANMTNEEAAQAKSLAGRLGAQAALAVDPIGPIRMKSKFEWLLGTQAAPNYRGVAAALGHGDPKELNADMTGVDVCFVLDASFSDKAKDPAVAADLRKAKFLVVIAWDATHPLCEIADVVLPGATHAEKSGTWTNLQGREQRIEQAFPPKGQAVPDEEILRRISARLFPESAHLPVHGAAAAANTAQATEA
jgi:predicted molibdopterin-dependent oxidoreductase YjgC